MNATLVPGPFLDKAWAFTRDATSPSRTGPCKAAACPADGAAAEFSRAAPYALRRIWNKQEGELFVCKHASLQHILPSLSG